MPTRMAAVKFEHVEAFMESLNARTKPATASNGFRALLQFFKSAVDEWQIEHSHAPARGSGRSQFLSSRVST